MLVNIMIFEATMCVSWVLPSCLCMIPSDLFPGMPTSTFLDLLGAVVVCRFIAICSQDGTCGS